MACRVDRCDLIPATGTLCQACNITTVCTRKSTCCLYKYCKLYTISVSAVGFYFCRTRSVQALYISHLEVMEIVWLEEQTFTINCSKFLRIFWNWYIFWCIYRPLKNKKRYLAFLVISLTFLMHHLLQLTIT